ncbi:MAG: hypothetical protein H0W83_13410 [Planctomycetes bacterium]|nr:hypothetical protein [Planctomycetota bacterium]
MDSLRAQVERTVIALWIGKVALWKDTLDRLVPPVESDLKNVDSVDA